MMFSEFLEFIQSEPAPSKPETAAPSPPSAIIGATLAAHRRPAEDHRPRHLRRRLQLPAHGLRRRPSAHHRQRQDPQHRHLRRGKDARRPARPSPRQHRRRSSATAAGGRNSESRPPLRRQHVNYWGQYVASPSPRPSSRHRPPPPPSASQYDADKPNVSTALDDPCPLSELQATRIASKRGDTDPPSPPRPSRSTRPTSLPSRPTTRWRCTPPSPCGTARIHPLRVARRASSTTTLSWPRCSACPRKTSRSSPASSAPASAASSSRGRTRRSPPRPRASSTGRSSSPSRASRCSPRSAIARAPSSACASAQRADGKLVSLQQDYRNHTSFIDDIRENCGEATPFLYSVPNLQVTSALVKRNVGTPTPMRGPGAVPGLFAVESAMDELAIKLKMDPVELRLAQRHPDRREQRQALLLAPSTRSACRSAPRSSAGPAAPLPSAPCARAT